MPSPTTALPNSKLMVEAWWLGATTRGPWAVQNDPDSSRPPGPAKGSHRQRPPAQGRSGHPPWVAGGAPLGAGNLQRQYPEPGEHSGTAVLRPHAQPCVPSCPQAHEGHSARRAAGQEAGRLHPRETRPVRRQTGDVGEVGPLRAWAVPAATGGGAPARRGAQALRGPEDRDAAVWREHRPRRHGGGPGAPAGPATPEPSASLARGRGRRAAASPHVAEAPSPPFSPVCPPQSRLFLARPQGSHPGDTLSSEATQPGPHTGCGWRLLKAAGLRSPTSLPRPGLTTGPAGQTSGPTCRVPGGPSRTLPRLTEEAWAQVCSFLLHPKFSL